MKNDPGDVIYAIDGVLELKRSQGDGGAEDGASSGASDGTAWLLNESTVKELLGLPWFGEGTGKSASQVSMRFVIMVPL